MQIAAIKYISLSELKLVNPKINKQWIENNLQAFQKMLFDLGVDTTQPIDVQENIQHRNIFENIVACDRFVCMERYDEEWVKSGYASQSAKDKSLGSKIMLDVYRLKGEVI